jgi:WD40 repeat protein
MRINRIRCRAVFPFPIPTFLGVLVRFTVIRAKEVCVLTGHSDEVVRIAISPNGQKLFSGSEDSTIKVRET